MRKNLIQLILFVALAISGSAISSPAMADETKVGPVIKIKMAADGKTAIATLKDNKTGEAVDINVSDELTLDKFKDKRIVEGDEIRAKYNNAGGKNESKSFKKTAGC